jgi:hypothetical protein
LEASWAAAADKAETVLWKTRNAKVNLWTQFERIIERAGWDRWDRLFQNHGASLEKELMGAFSGERHGKLVGKFSSDGDEILCDEDERVIPGRCKSRKLNDQSCSIENGRNYNQRGLQIRQQQLPWRLHLGYIWRCQPEF